MPPDDEWMFQAPDGLPPTTMLPLDADTVAGPSTPVTWTSPDAEDTTTSPFPSCATRTAPDPELAFTAPPTADALTEPDPAARIQAGRPGDVDATRAGARRHPAPDAADGDAPRPAGCVDRPLQIPDVDAPYLVFALTLVSAGTVTS